jgi:hypothetical protein
MDWVRKDQRETRDIPAGVRLRSICRERRTRRLRYAKVARPASAGCGVNYDG